MDYLRSIQEKYKLDETRRLFSDCKERYLKSAALVGKFNEMIKKLEEGKTFLSDHPRQIIEAIQERYHSSYNDEQILLFEPYEEMIKRRWFDFIHKVIQALANDNYFCRSYLRISGFLGGDERGLSLSTALEIVEDLELGWYISDEPEKENNEDYST